MPLDEQVQFETMKAADTLMEKFFKVEYDSFPAWAKMALDSFFGQLDPDPVVKWDTFCQTIVDQGYCDQATGDMIRTLKSEQGIMGSIMRLVMKMILYVKTFTSASDIYDIERQLNLMALATPNPAPVDALVGSMMIDPKRATENRAQMKKLGYNDTQIDNIILASYARVDTGTIRINYLRGNYTVEKLYERMRELGYTDTRIKEIVDTWNLYPSPQDLFTMVAHEAFEPDQYTNLGLNEEFPEEQVPWLEAQGISKEWAMKFWISHWIEPSLGQGFEMLHRGVIGLDTLDMLFRTVEVPRFWRDKLTAIAYIPYTRVDVRRMHDLGVLTTEELVAAYQDQGYDAGKAVKMAEFTIKYNEQARNDLTRAAVLTSYHDDLISRTDAKDLLTSQDISDDSAEYYLTMEDYKIAQETVTIYIGTLKERYLLGVDNEAQTRSSLNQLNLRGTKIEALMSSWGVDLYKYQSLPSKSELASMLVSKIITEGQWRELMTRLGYAYEYQGWYLQILQDQRDSPGTSPTRSDLQSWLTKKVITEDIFRKEMHYLGYADRYIDMYLKAM